jgi:putative transposase
MIKGESSFWINENRLCRQLFSWQESYAAFSVTPWHHRRVSRYIYKQESHHGGNRVVPYIEGLENLAADLNPPQGWEEI